MSYLDPHGSAEPRGWEGQNGPTSRRWPDSDGAHPRARHAGAAPDAYPAHPGDEPGPGYRDERGSGYRDERGSGYRDDPSGGRNGRPTPGYRTADFEATGPGAGGPAYPWRGRDGDPDLTDPVGLPPVTAPPTTGRPLRAPSAGPEPQNDPAGQGQRRPRTGRRRATRSGRPAKPGRAGRNLPAAIGVGLGLGTVIVVPLFLFRPAFLAVIAAAVGIGIWEMARAVRRSGAHPPLVPLIVGGVLMIGLAWWAGPDALSLGLLITVLATLVWRLGDGPAGFQRDLTAAALIAVYVPFLAGFAALLAVPPDGDLRVLVTFAAVVLSDTGGYGAGVWLGRHPMAPSVSPKKSWEGFGGSLVAAGLGSALLLWLLLGVAPWWGALFGLAVSVAAVLGDLGESMIKRDLGIKDMSNLLPGHGGLMDRLDSILFALPVAYLLLSLFAPVS